MAKTTYPSPFLSDPKAGLDTGKRQGPTLEGAVLNVLSSKLDGIIKKFPDLSKFGKEIMFDEYINKFSQSNKKQSELFEDLLDSQQTIISGVLDTQSRYQAKTNKKMLDYFEKEIKGLATGGEITDEETKFFKEMISELKQTNKNLIENDYSIKSVLKTKIKERLPSLTGILGAVGLDNPAFLFLGELVQDMVNASREQKKSQEDLFSKVKERQLKGKLSDVGIIGEEDDQIEDALDDFEKEFRGEALKLTSDHMKMLSDQNEITTDNLQDMGNRYIDLISRMSNFLSGTNSVMKEGFNDANLWLESIEDSMNVLTKDAQGSRFAEIEKAREDQIRHDELIDAMENQNTFRMAPDEVDSKSSSSIEKVGSWYDSLMLTISAWGPLMKMLAGFGKFALKWTGIGTIAFAAIDFLFGAFEGWTNAADKLGKNLSELTVFDKITAAFAGGVGKVLSFVDEIFGFFGIKTNIGPYVEKKIIDLYKFFTNDIGEFFKDFWNTLTNKIKGIPEKIKKETSNWGKDTGPDVISSSELNAAKPVTKQTNKMPQNNEIYWGDLDVVPKKKEAPKEKSKKETSLPMPISSGPSSKYDAMIERIAREEGVDPGLAKRMMKQESGFNPNAKSHKGATGLMQLMPGTAKEMGVTDINDPEQNIRGGIKYLAQQLKAEGGDVRRALAAYNAGPGKLKKLGMEGVMKIPETRDYVNKIAGPAEATIVSEPKTQLAQQKTAALQESKIKEAQAKQTSSASANLVNASRTTVNNSNQTNATYTGLNAGNNDMSIAYAPAMRNY